MKYLLLLFLLLSHNTYASIAIADQDGNNPERSSSTASYAPDDQKSDCASSEDHQRNNRCFVSTDQAFCAQAYGLYGPPLSKRLLAILRNTPTPSLSNPAFITSDFILRGSTFIHQDSSGKYWLKLAAYQRLDHPGTDRHDDVTTQHPVRAFFHKTSVDPLIDPSAAWSLITLDMLLTNEQILTVQAGLESVLLALHAPEAFLQPRKSHRSEEQPLTYDDGPVKYTDGCMAVRPRSPHTQERQK